MRPLTIRRLLVSIVVLFAVAALGAPCVADSAELSADWLTFRGDPRQHGYRSGRMRRLRLLWTLEAGTGSESTAAIAGERVIVGTDGGLLALALEPRGDDGEPASEGRRLWALETEGAMRAAPALRGGVAFIGDDFGVFRAVKIADGSVVWTFDPDTGAEILCSAAFHRDNVLYGSYDGYLYCLEAKSGKLVWKLETGGPVHATPAIADGHTFVAGCDEILHVVELQKGREISAFPLGSNCASSPAVLDEDLFVGTFANQVLRLKWRAPPVGDRVSPSGGDDEKEAGVTESSGDRSDKRPRLESEPQDETRSEEGAPEDVETRSEHVVWRYEHPGRSFPFYASPAVGPLPRNGRSDRARNVVVIGGRDKMLHALDAESGRALWTVATGARIDGSAVIVGDSVVVGGMDGNVYLFDLASGEERWRYTAGAPFAASPAVGRGRVVITSQDGVVHCFEALDDNP